MHLLIVKEYLTWILFDGKIDKISLLNHKAKITLFGQLYGFYINQLIIAYLVYIQVNILSIILLLLSSPFFTEKGLLSGSNEVSPGQEEGKCWAGIVCHAEMEV